MMAASQVLIFAPANPAKQVGQGRESTSRGLPVPGRPNDGIRRLEFVGVPKVKVAGVDHAVGIEIARAPSRRECELIAVPAIEVTRIDEAIQICVAIQVRIARCEVLASRLCQPRIPIVSINETVAIEVECGVVRPGHDGRGERVNIQAIHRTIVVEITVHQLDRIADKIG